MLFLNVNHFKSEEFDSPDSPGSGIRMNLNFVRRLDKLREDCNFPFKIHSGIRTEEHNKNVGGVSESEHCDGEGVDIEILDSTKRFLIIQKAIGAGFNRIGIGKTFVHLGVSKTLTQFVMWTYY